MQGLVQAQVQELVQAGVQVQVQVQVQMLVQMQVQMHEQGLWLSSCGVAAESYVQLGLPLPAGDVWHVAGLHTQPFASVPGA